MKRRFAPAMPALAVLALLIGVAPLFAQLEAEPETGSATVTLETPTVVAPEAPAQPEFLAIDGDQEDDSVDQDNLISITLDDVEMVDVVRMFTRISGANIIATPSNLTGRVTVNLTDVQWKPALESILDMHGLALQEKLPGSGVYSIVVQVPGAPEPMKVKTFFLEYASVSNVTPVVKSMLTSGGTISSYPSQNALVVRSTAANLGEIEQVISEIDMMRDQVFIETKFMELNDDAIRDLGINWQMLQGYGIGASSLALTLNENRAWSDGRTDSRARGNERSNLDQIDERFDIYNEQYEEREVSIETVPNTDILIEQEEITPTRTITDAANIRDERLLNEDGSFSRTLTDARTAVLAADDFRVVLSALKQTDGVSVISNPKIIVANEQTAEIHIGQTERPFESSVTPGQQGIAPVITYNPGEPVKIGVQLKVTPTVNTESNITVRIQPKLTRFLRDAVAPNGQTFPIIAEKTIETIFCLESGKTVAIGGLTETRDREVNSKIPLLGDIPLLGKYLFSHSHMEKGQQETIIFVTVGLAKPHSIMHETGLPEDTRLVRKRMIAEEVKRKEFEAEILMMRQAADEDAAKETSKVKSRLLRRRQ